MSNLIRLTDLEAEAFANAARIQALSSTNAELAAKNRQQRSLSARYESHFANSNPAREAAPSSLIQRHLPPPGTSPTPFYITARTAPTLKLSFVVPGCNGETLDFEAEILDLAFVLERTLKKRGFRERMVQKGVLDFLQVSLVKAEWTGKEGEIGKLV
jgi:hypothetical protein